MRDLAIEYSGVRDLDICRQILNQFGQVNDVVADNSDADNPIAASTYIEAGNTISGFVGGDDGNVTGCESDSGAYVLNVRID